MVADFLAPSVFLLQLYYLHLSFCYIWLKLSSGSSTPHCFKLLSPLSFLFHILNFNSRLSFIERRQSSVAELVWVWVSETSNLNLSSNNCLMNDLGYISFFTPSLPPVSIQASSFLPGVISSYQLPAGISEFLLIMWALRFTTLLTVSGTQCSKTSLE